MPEQDRFERLERRVTAEADYALALRALRESPAWAALAEQMSRAKELVIAAHVRAAMRGVVLEQRQLDYDRGYWDGIENLLQQPERARQTLETSLEKLRRLEDRRSA